MNDLTRAAIWVRFAAAAMGVGDPAENTTIAAKAADRMLLEFEKRFTVPKAPTASMLAEKPS